MLPAARRLLRTFKQWRLRGVYFLSAVIESPPNLDAQTLRQFYETCLSFPRTFSDKHRYCHNKGRRAAVTLTWPQLTLSRWEMWDATSFSGRLCLIQTVWLSTFYTRRAVRQLQLRKTCRRSAADGQREAGKNHTDRRSPCEGARDSGKLRQWSAKTVKAT